MNIIRYLAAAAAGTAIFTAFLTMGLYLGPITGPSITKEKFDAVMDVCLGMGALGVIGLLWFGDFED